MWPLSFLETIRKQTQGDSLVPVLDRQWVLLWQESMDRCISGAQAAGSNTEQQSLWCEGIEQLNVLKEKIREHNSKIAKYYAKALIEKIAELPEHLRFEILHQSEADNVFIGYKGVSLTRAAKVHEDDLNPLKEIIGPAGASRGAGFYVTSHFETALDFAKYAAICEAAKQNPSMLEPVLPANVKDITAFDRYCRAQEMFEERKRAFEKSDEWKQFGIIVRIYSNDFFSMYGHVLADPAAALPADWDSYDYLEGQMQGGFSDQWEIKFNKKAGVYSRIIVTQDPRLDSCPNLPQGVNKMLEIVKEFVTSTTIDLGAIADDHMAKP